MPTRHLRNCGQPGCPVLVTSGYCDAHRKTNAYERKAHRNLGKPWENFKASLKAVGNVICQRVRNGVRCSAPVYIFHHILDVNERPDLELNQNNVVGVCEHCHPNPQARDQGEFVPTLWRTPMSDEPVPAILFPPGGRIPPGVTLWTRANRLEFFKR